MFVQNLLISCKLQQREGKYSLEVPRYQLPLKAHTLQQTSATELLLEGITYEFYVYFLYEKLCLFYFSNLSLDLFSFKHRKWMGKLCQNVEVEPKIKFDLFLNIRKKKTLAVERFINSIQKSGK